MKTNSIRFNYLLTAILMCLVNINVFGQETIFKESFGAIDVTEDAKTIAAADMNATAYPESSLKAVVELTLTGTWETAQVDLLKAALKASATATGNGVLEKVTFAADAVINDMSHLFEKCSKLASVTMPTQENTSAVNFEFAFSGCTKLAKIDISAFVNISSMESAFNNTYILENITMPTKNNASAVSFKNAFYYSADKGKSTIDISAFSNITDMNAAFFGARVKTIKMPTTVNNSAVDFTKAFNGSYLADPIDLSGFVNITSLDNTFTNCAKLSSVTLPTTPNTNEISLAGAFSGCSVINQPIDISSFTNISSLKGAFNGCKLLPEIKLPTVENTKEFDLTAAFSTLGITTLDLSVFPNITSLSNTFSNCSKLESVTFSSKENTSALNLNGLFSGCSTLTTADISMFTNITKMDMAFKSCKNLKEVKLPAKVNANAISSTFLFAECESLETPLDLSNFTGLINFHSTFMGCKKLPEVKLSSVENSYEMHLINAFDSCGVLRGPVDLSGYTNIIEMTKSFRGCSMLQGVEMPVKEQKEGSKFVNTFEGCAGLIEPIDLSAYSNIEDITSAFDSCTSLPAVVFGCIPYAFDGAFRKANPNCLKYLMKVEAGGGEGEEEGDGPGLNPLAETELPDTWKQLSNVIFDGKAIADMILEDKTFYCPKAFDLGEFKITYTRNFTGNFANKIQGWNTICLPFDATLTAENNGINPFANENREYWLRELTSAIADSLVFTDAASIKANTPYVLALPGNELTDMISMEGKTIKFSASNITVPATPEKLEGGAVANFAYAGTFAPIEKRPMYTLIRGSNKELDAFVYAEEGNVAPFRAYVTALNDEAKKTTSLNLSAVHPDPISGIDMLTAEQGARIYTLDGVLTIDVPQAGRIEIYAVDGRMVRIVELQAGTNRIDNLNAGVYIVGGNKVVTGY